MDDVKIFSVVTEAGEADITRCFTSDERIQWDKIAVGDGGGSTYTPNAQMKALRHECWKGDVSYVSPVYETSNQIRFEATIPHDVGGFTIREIGLFNEEDELVAISNTPTIQKVASNTGAFLDMAIEFEIIVSNTEVFDFVVDPYVSVATKNDIDELREKVDRLVTPITFERIDQIIQSVTGVTPALVVERISDQVMDQILDDNPDNDPTYPPPDSEYFQVYDVVGDDELDKILDDDPGNDPEYAE